MSRWREIKLGDFVRLQRGHDLPKQNRKSGTVPVVGSAGPNGTHSIFRAKGPGVVVGRSGASVGKVHYVTQDFWPHNTGMYVTDFLGNNPRFVAYALSSVDLASFNSGSAQPSLNRNFLYTYDMRVPDLATQQRIASILSAYDNLIENNSRRISILEEMARRFYEEWFVRFRFPGHEQSKYVNTQVGRCPSDWAVSPMQEICSRITDGAHKSPPSTEIGMPMASVKDMTDWGFKIDGCRRISEEDYEDLVRNNCKPLLGDVVIAKDGSYLKHTFAIHKEIDLVLLSSIAILRPNELVLPNFLAIALRHPDLVARMKGVVSGVAIPRIVLKDFRAFRLVVPPTSLQQKWASITDAMLDECRTLIDVSTNLRAQRELLLPKLVSGEIDVSVAEKSLEDAA